jgi:hypothetical protein
MSQNEVIGFFPNPTPQPTHQPGDLVIAGCELDRSHENDRYFVLYCHLIDDENGVEQTWLVLKNMDDGTNVIHVKFFDVDGTELTNDELELESDPNELQFIGPDCGMPEEEAFSVEITSDYPISGWLKRS